MGFMRSSRGDVASGMQHIYQGCGVRDGSQAIFGTRESPNFSLKCPTPDSLEMSHFYVKNLRKCDISEKKILRKIFFRYKNFLVD